MFEQAISMLQQLGILSAIQVMAIAGVAIYLYDRFTRNS